MSVEEPPYEKMLSPGEVARIFRVNPKTVARWARTGKLDSVRTPGGHRRFPESAIRRLLAEPAELRSR